MNIVLIYFKIESTGEVGIIRNYTIQFLSIEIDIELMSIPSSMYTAARVIEEGKEY